MQQIILGNAFMLISAVSMIASGLPKTKRSSLIFQFIDSIAATIGLFFLGSLAGSLVCVFSIVTDVLCYKEKLNKITKPLVTIPCVAISLFVNNIGIYGFLPVAAFIITTWTMSTKNMYKYKFAFLAAIILWLIHDISIVSYVDVVCDTLFFIATIIGIVRLKRNKHDIINHNITKH